MPPTTGSMDATGAVMRCPLGWPTSSAAFKRSGPPRRLWRRKRPIRRILMTRVDRVLRLACAGKDEPCGERTAGRLIALQLHGSGQPDPADPGRVRAGLQRADCG